MSKRIKGKKLGLTIDGKEYWADVSSCTLENEERDGGTITFRDASLPGEDRQHFLNITAIQSTDPESLWSFIWDRTGEEVPFMYAVHGNETPATDQPHIIGTVKIGPRPLLGGEASRGQEDYTFESRWDCVGTPVLDRGN